MSASLLSAQWVAERKGYKAVVCLQYKRKSASSRTLLVGVMMVVQHKVRSLDRELWELTLSAAGRGLGLTFVKLPAHAVFKTWSEQFSAKGRECFVIARAKKPEMFLRRYLLRSDPTAILPKRTVVDGKTFATEARTTTVENKTDWTDLNDEEGVRELLQSIDRIREELRGFPIHHFNSSQKCFELHKDLRHASSATRHFKDLLDDVVKLLCNGELGREDVIARCSVLSKHGDPAAVLDRVLAMDAWGGEYYCEPGSEIHKYRRGGVLTYGLTKNIQCEECKGRDKSEDMALCDSCGIGMHCDCMPDEIRESFRKAAKEHTEWLCEKCAGQGEPIVTTGEDAGPSAGVLSGAHTATSSATQPVEEQLVSDDDDDDDDDFRIHPVNQDDDEPEPAVPPSQIHGQLMNGNAAAGFVSDELWASQKRRRVHVAAGDRRGGPVESNISGGSEEEFAEGRSTGGAAAISMRPQEVPRHQRPPRYIGRKDAVTARATDAPFLPTLTPAVRERQPRPVPANAIGRAAQFDSEHGAVLEDDAQGGHIAGRVGTEPQGRMQRNERNNHEVRLSSQLVTRGSVRCEGQGSRNIEPQPRAPEKEAEVGALLLFPGDPSAIWTTADAKALMDDRGKLKDLVNKICYNIFPHLKQATEQDIDAVCDLAQKFFDNPAQPQVDRETILMRRLCDLHHTLKQEASRMQARAWRRLLPQVILLLDEVYYGPSERTFSREAIERDNRDSVFLPCMPGV